jgi:4-hydroxyisophthalate hydroxylase
MIEADVIINGGGPVGMGLAIELGQRGVRVAVIERNETPAPIPKGQNLTQRTAEHFRAWGCESELRTAWPLPPDAGIGGVTAYGTLLSGHSYDWLNRGHVRDFYFCANARLPQYATESVLRARAQNLDTVSLHVGLTATGLEMTDTAATLDATDKTGAKHIFRGRYVVGCDGSRSFVRGAAGITETLSEHNRLMALLVFQSTELHELLERYPGKAFYNVLHPDFQGYWQFFGRVDHGKSWFFHAPVPHGTTADNHDFTAMLHNAVGQEFALQLDYVGLWDLRVAIANAYRKGHAFIAGDAAHSHPPYGGYGINTGFEDARNLGWKLAATLQGWGGTSLLYSYDAERRPVFASTARDFIERFIEDDNAFLQRYHPDRDRAEFEQAWHGRNLDAAEVNAFEPHYEGSPVIGGAGQPSAHGNHVHAPRAGHHISPKALKSAGGDPWDDLSAGFTVFAQDEATLSAFDHAARAFNVPLVARKRADGPDILVRPDHFVAWCGTTEPAGAADILRRATGHGG